MPTGFGLALGVPFPRGIFDAGPTPPGDPGSYWGNSYWGESYWGDGYWT